MRKIYLLKNHRQTAMTPSQPNLEIPRSSRIKTTSSAQTPSTTIGSNLQKGKCNLRETGRTNDGINPTNGRSKEATAKSQRNIALALEEKRATKALFTQLLASHKAALIRGSTIDTAIEPTEITQSCSLLFEATSSHAGFILLPDMMNQSKAVADYSPAHQEGICKDGIIWSDFQHPELLTVFACFQPVTYQRNSSA
jgi:hypothetical protein